MNLYKNKMENINKQVTLSKANYDSISIYKYDQRDCKKHTGLIRFKSTCLEATYRIDAHSLEEILVLVHEYINSLPDK